MVQMEDKTTTESTPTSEGGINGVAIDSQGMAIPEPEQGQETAVSHTEEPVREQETAQDTGEVDKTDDDLSKWAANKGIEITNESERKLADMARNSEKAMHTKASEKSELQKQVVQAPTDEYGDPLTSLQQEVQNLKLEQSVRNFYQDHPDAKDMDGELAKIVEQRPHLAGDLEALYAVAKVNQLGSQEANIRKDGGREALEKLANRQKAASPSANATSNQASTTQITSANVDALIERNGQEWFTKNYDAIRAVIER